MIGGSNKKGIPITTVTLSAKPVTKMESVVSANMQMTMESPPKTYYSPIIIEQI